MPVSLEFDSTHKYTEATDGINVPITLAIVRALVQISVENSRIAAAKSPISQATGPHSDAAIDLETHTHAATDIVSCALPFTIRKTGVATRWQNCPARAGSRNPGQSDFHEI